jgi:hypothetical protein
MMKKINLIELPIWVGKINDLDHKQIVDDIINHGQTIEQTREECGILSRGFVQFEDMIMPVTKEVTKLETKVKKTLQSIFSKEYEIQDIWAVNLVNNQSVISHTHYSNLHLDPSEYYSVAYYPQAPEGSAELIFDYDYCGVMSGIYSVKPEVGTLVVFNSYIKHMTSRNKSTEPRLVVSMNLGPTEPRVDPNADWSVYRNRPIV